MKSIKTAQQTTFEEPGEGRIVSQKFDPVTGISEFQQMILDHYTRHGRPMPWRDNTEPYSILVSEIMLQQTQVERVLTKYPEFIAAFPDFSSLAKAPLVDILSAWQGLGYNRRAIALQKCAQRVMNEYGGVLPEDVETLSSFPGIGRATASSICAFAFNQPVLFIETNIRRVFIHCFFSDTANVSDAEILPLVEKSVYVDNPRVWYWALMDLGSSLKKTIVNPNRRSIHYIKQSPFEGSDRKIRGELLKLVIKEKFLDEEEVVTRFGANHLRIRKILHALEEEGFLCRRNDRIVPSE